MRNVNVSDNAVVVVLTPIQAQQLDKWLTEVAGGRPATGVYRAISPCPRVVLDKIMRAVGK